MHGLKEMLTPSGDSAAEALSAWCQGTFKWSHRIGVETGSIMELCGPLRVPPSVGKVRSVGMDTHGELSGTLIIHGTEPDLVAASEAVSSQMPTEEGDQVDRAVLEIANVIGSAYLNALREASGIESEDDQTFLPSPPGWHHLPLATVVHLALCGQGQIHDGIVVRHDLTGTDPARATATAELVGVGLGGVGHVPTPVGPTLVCLWVPSFVALDQLETAPGARSPVGVSG